MITASNFAIIRNALGLDIWPAGRIPADDLAVIGFACAHGRLRAFDFAIICDAMIAAGRLPIIADALALGEGVAGAKQ